MIAIRQLRSVDDDVLFRCFVEAFSDYIVPMKPGREQFAEMLQRRGYRPELSVGAFDDGTLVGFTLNGSGRWDGGAAAYDTGTGVVPSYRRRGLSKQMIERVFAL